MRKSINVIVFIFVIVGVLYGDFKSDNSIKYVKGITYCLESIKVKENNSTGTYGNCDISYYNLVIDGGVWDGLHYKINEDIVVDSFFTDGTYTYYLQADGTPMKDVITYHPDGRHIIYFDTYGHEVFNAFKYCSTVGYTCYFDNYGYLYKDEIAFVNSIPYYLDATGKLQQTGWFRFANGVDFGYANEDGSLRNNCFEEDNQGRKFFYHWNGMVARGLITDGYWYYDMDETDGHMLGRFSLMDVYYRDSRECFQYINALRCEKGLSSISWNDNLYQACQRRAQEIPLRFSHTRPDGSSCFTVIQDMGIRYRYAGECIAMGYNKPNSVFREWCDSAGHYDAIVNSSSNSGAVARCGNYWIFLTAGVY